MRALRIEPILARGSTAALQALTGLWIEAFRAFPYLYDGTLDYEQRDLERFGSAEGALFVAA